MSDEKRIALALLLGTIVGAALPPLGGLTGRPDANVAAAQSATATDGRDLSSANRTRTTTALPF